MVTRETRRARGQRRALRLRIEIGRDLREARIGAGLTLEQVGRVVGVSHTHIRRVEQAHVVGVSLDLLSRIGAVVGMDIAARAYPGPDPLRDAAHVALLERLHRELGPGLIWRNEAPIGPARDLRAWDSGIQEGALAGARRFGVEAETAFRDAQAFMRRTVQKARDSEVDGVILLLARTRANREALAVALPLLRELFPLDSTRVLRALRTGGLPPTGGIVLL